MDSDYAHDRRTREDRWEQYDPTRDYINRLKPYAARLPDIKKSLWPDFSEYLVSRNLDPYIAKANLWYPSQSAGDNLPRIVMPAASDQEANHFWQARLMGCGDKRYQSPHGCRSGDATIIVYPFGRTQEVLTGHPEWTESVVVEGPMCALAAAGTGRLGVSTMGADPPEERLDLIYKRIRGTMCTYVIPDTDRCLAFLNVFTYLTNRGVTCKWRVPVPSAKDFADMSLLSRESFF